MTHSAITCPACKRVLNLPGEALNRVVQCPACKHQFHPAEAMPAESVRPAIPNLNYAAPAAAPPQTAPTVEAPAAPRPPERRSAPPAPPANFDVRRSDRRGKRELEDMCPKCQAFVPRGVNKCPECGAEFEADDDYRPWEGEGMERRDSEPHRGGMLLIMGIVSLLTPVSFVACWIGVGITILGILLSGGAVWMGLKDLKKMREHVMVREGHGMTQAGLICGGIGMALNIMGLIAAISLIAIT